MLRIHVVVYHVLSQLHEAPGEHQSGGGDGLGGGGGDGGGGGGGGGGNGAGGGDGGQRPMAPQSTFSWFPQLELAEKAAWMAALLQSLSAVVEKALWKLDTFETSQLLTGWLKDDA